MSRFPHSLSRGDDESPHIARAKYARAPRIVHRKSVTRDYLLIPMVVDRYTHIELERALVVYNKVGAETSFLQRRIVTEPHEDDDSRNYRLPVKFNNFLIARHARLVRRSERKDFHFTNCYCWYSP